jgi:hypothetical protein
LIDVDPVLQSEQLRLMRLGTGVLHGDLDGSRRDRIRCPERVVGRADLERRRFRGLGRRLFCTRGEHHHHRDGECSDRPPHFVHLRSS